ncbi:MAG: MFS transporter [Caulobacteraceae bacterium]
MDQRATAAHPDLAPDARAPYPGALTAWFAVSVFALAQIMSTVDRGMIALMIDPIRHDLHISDVQIALLQGLAFAIFYVAVGVPLGFIADRLNRRRLLIGGVLAWCAATVACGLAHSFGDMFAARLMVGLGEAVLAPCAVTMIGDLFPPSRRGPPMALYILGSMVAVGIGSAATGSILKLAPQGVFDVIPVLRGLPAWRIAFMVLGASGVAIAILVFFLKEPQRRGVVLEARQGLGLRQAVAYLVENWAVFLPFYTAVAAYAVGIGLAIVWGPAVLIRGYGLSAGGLGQVLGGAQFVAAVLGAICAALVIDPVVRRSGVGGKLKLSALIALLAVPSTLPWVASAPGLAIAMTAEAMFIGALYGSTMLSTMTELVPSNMKGVSVSLYAFVVTMVGMSLGPLLVAQVNDAFFHDPKLIGRAVTVVGASALILSALLALLTHRNFARAIARKGGFARVLDANLR